MRVKEKHYRFYDEWTRSNITASDLARRHGMNPRRGTRWISEIGASENCDIGLQLVRALDYLRDGDAEGAELKVRQCLKLVEDRG